MADQTPTAQNKVGSENPGARGRGRPKGTPNKTTALAKEAIALAFEKLGGTDELVKWAKLNDDNRKVFYAQIWTKVIPLQVNGAGDDGEHIHKILLEGVAAR